MFLEEDIITQIRAGVLVWLAMDPIEKKSNFQRQHVSYLSIGIDT